MIIGTTGIGVLPAIGDSYVQKTKTYDMGLLDDVDSGRYGVNLLLAIRPAFDYTIDSMLMKVSKLGIPISLYLKNDVARYEMNILISSNPANRIPSESVINTLFWTYGDMFDSIWRKMDTMTSEAIISRAYGSQLDDFWGTIYELPRRTGYTDEQYRQYLSSYNDVLRGCGTIPNCKIIIDRIIGIDGETNIETRWPCNIKITFASDAGMRAAIKNKSVIDSMIPRMIASGISSDLLIPLIDYDMDIRTLGHMEFAYFVGVYLGTQNNELKYNAKLTLAARGLKGALFDIVKKNCSWQTFTIDLVNKKPFDKSVIYNMLNKKQLSANVTVDTLLNKHIYKLLLMDIATGKINRVSTLNNIISEKSGIIRIKYNVNLRQQGILGIPTDIIINTRYYFNNINNDIVIRKNNDSTTIGFSIRLINEEELQ